MSSHSSERTPSAAAGGASPATGNPLAGAHHFISMKLTSRNFLFWITQLLPFLRGQDLIGFVDGTHPCPPAFITESSGGSGSGATTSAPSVPNPAHKAWVLQDQSILSLLISSMSDEVLHLAVGRNSAAEVWRSICAALGSNTQARCLSLLGQFQALQQGASTPCDYLGKAELLVEALAQAGQPMSLAEQNLYVLRGLRPEYRAYAASLTAHAPVSLPHLADHLQAADFILADDFADGAAPTALYAGRGSGGSGRGGSGGSNNAGNGGRQFGWRGGRDRNRGGGRNQRVFHGAKSVEHMDILPFIATNGTRPNHRLKPM
ncbi:PREDICTED: uncharacterized protein LOC109169848 [Ipomoea nil]|uniref:uncharacterized protein LOC109169848 n=1 Tax=Ipomoea nil TaxID=35883 RepID=UPI000901DC99|nr:PREDICTED: uncharacterized protein LOC109169848 [Ipomoea nil]